MGKEADSNNLKPEQFEDETVMIIVKHNGKLYVKGRRMNIETEQGLHNTLVALDHLAYACQKTVFYDPEFGAMPEDKLFDLEANVQAGEPWIVDRYPNGVKPADTTVADVGVMVNKEMRRRARKKRKGQS